MINDVKYIELNKKIEELEKENIFLKKKLEEKIAYENELTDSKKTLENIFDKVSIPIFTKNPDGIYTNCNNAFAEFVNLKKNQIIGFSVLDIIVEDEANYFAKKDADMFAGETKQCYEKEILNFQGKDKCFIVNKIIYKDSKTNKNAILGMLIDITELKKTEKDLKESKEFFANISNNMLDMICITDSNGNITYANPSYEKNLGYKSAEFLGCNIFDFIHPKDRNLVNKEFIEKLKNKKSGIIEYQFKDSSGNYRWLESTGNSLIDEEGNIYGAIFGTRDISKSVKSKENLNFLFNAALSFLQLISLDDIFDFILEKFSSLFPDSVIILSKYYTENSNALKIKSVTGCDNLKEIEGKKIILPNKLLSEINLYDGKVNVIDSKYFNVDFGDNEMLSFKAIIESLRVKKVYYAGLSLKNELFGSIAIFPKDKKEIENIIAIKQLLYQASIALYRQKIESDLIVAKENADKLKSAFLTNMSHEIRTPMNGVLGFTQLLLRKKQPEEKAKRYLNLIYDNSKQLLNIINDIIDLSKIEAGQLNINNSKFNLNELIYSISSFFKKYNSNKINSEIEFGCYTSLQDNKSEILADKNRLFQILINLLDNAFKFTTKGSVSFGYNINYKENTIEFSVRDTGIGIAEEHTEVIFQRFMRGDSENTRKYGGTGLGLSISKQLVELMGGKVSVESTLGNGSVFSFTVPYKSVIMLEEQKAKIVVNDIDWSDKTILLVEDDYPSYIFIEAALEKVKVNLLWIEKGNTALEMCKVNKKIDLILIDIRLPEINGYELTKKIRKFNPDIPIIAQTANTMEGDWQKALSMGCNDYISKPIDINLLIKKISKYFDKK